MAEGYANIMGEGLEDYANFGMDNYGDGETLASTNGNKGLRATITATDKPYNEKTATDQEKFEHRSDNGEIDYKREQLSRKVDIDIPVIKKDDKQHHKMEIITRTSPSEFTKKQKNMENL
jgi:hypothetical protein